MDNSHSIYNALVSAGLPQEINNPTPAFTDNSHVVQKRRYLSKDKEGNILENTDGMFRRVAKNLSQADLNYPAPPGLTPEESMQQTEDKFYALMRSLDFLPNSPTLMNAGRELQQLSACFVLPVEDSLESIFTRVKQTALIHQSGGGTGFSFNRLRPHGDIVGSTGGVASGPVSFIRAFDTATDVVKQGGTRRGANMAILNVNHPDIIEFIKSKEDGTQLQNFNISVAITEGFIQKVLAGQDYDLINPRNNQVTGQLNAREVFNLIVEMAWKTGDPGLVFLDRVNRANPNPQLGQIESTNPCWSGDTLVWTIRGPRRFDQIVGQEIPVLTILKNGTMAFKMMRNIRLTHSNAKVIKVTLISKAGRRNRRGSITTLTLTPTHNLYLKNGVQIQAQELKIGDRLASVYRSSANSKGYLRLANGTDADMEHRIVMSWELGRRPDYPEEHVDHIDENKQNNLPENLRVLHHTIHNSVKMLGERNPANRFPEKNPFNKGFFGPENGMWGRKHSEETKAKIGVKTRERNLHKINHEVIAIEELNELIPVYNGTVDETHKYYVQCGEDEGVLSANCGEQPLLPFESCNLGSINLARTVNYANNAVTIDFARLRQTVHAAVHLLDNVIDMNEYPIPEIAEMSRETRRIGVGVMGFADLLVQMGIKYDSDDALSLATEVMHFIQQEAYIASRELSRHRGTFPSWEGSIYGQSERFGYVMPMRNSAPVTIAPTGTISIIAGASSGIEPLFALSYTRNVMDNDRLIEVNPYFEAVAKHEGFYSEELMQELAQKGSLETLEVPPWVKEVFRVSHDISPEWHVKIQAAFQKHTDNAVSKTINFPHSATKEDVANAYMLAYETGCKGITIYRDGSKENQVLSTGETGKQLAMPLVHVNGHTMPKDRPAVMSGVTERVLTGHGKMYITINFDDSGKPFEVFSALGKAGGCDSAQLEAISRLTALALRSGVEPSQVIDQLRGITCCPSWDDGTLVRSTPDAVAIALGRHTNGHVDVGDWRLTKCPECQGETYYQEGCVKCMSCGWNRCE